jgi:hypothetical protein
MKQPRIRIKDTHGKDYGEKPVTAIHWNNDGEIISITVNFMGSDMYPMVMIPDGNSSSFKNVKGNLIAQFATTPFTHENIIT